MNVMEAHRLLSVMTIIDSRQVSEEAAMGWAAILDSDMPYQEAVRLVHRHYADSVEWLKPAHLNRLWRDLKTQRLKDHGGIPNPENVTDPQEWVAWKRAYAAAVAAGDSDPATTASHRSGVRALIEAAQ